MVMMSNGQKTLMKDPGTRAMFQGISLHYYSVVNGWEFKGSATKFDEREWFETFPAESWILII